MLSYPLINLRELEAKESSDAVCWKITLLHPSIDRIFGYPQMGSHVVDTDPALFCGHLKILFVIGRKLCLRMPTEPDVNILNSSKQVKK
jgi:hypothetical protein